MNSLNSFNLMKVINDTTCNIVKKITTHCQSGFWLYNETMLLQKDSLVCDMKYMHIACLQKFRFLADFRLFFIFLDHFCESSRTVEKIFEQKVGKLARLWDVFSCDVLDLHWKVPTESEKSQINKCYNSDVRVCIISWIN